MQMRKSGRVVLALALGTVLAELSPYAKGDATWTGTTNQDWNTGTNWSANPPGAQNYIINNTLNPGVFPVISANLATGFTPVDLFVGTGAATARLDHIAGTAGTGNGNWFFLGITAANATYNLANTAATGGTYTGFAQGSGSFNVGGASQNGNLFVGLDNGTVATLNINTSGTLAGGGLMVGGNGSTSATGTVNLDNGTVNFSGEAQIGSSFFGNGKNGTLNVSGGTLTADIITFARGANNAAAMVGTGTITGGTLNSKRWFTLGYAGSATNTANVTNNGGTINVNTLTGGAGVLEMGVFDATVNTFTLTTGTVTLQNNSSIVFGSGGNHTGTSTFNQNGGTVTFYSDGGTTVGGTGSLNLGSGNSTGTYVYNLSAGTLTVPSVRKSGAGASSSTFNFNGGTLKATTDTATFMTGLTAANVQNGGAIIDTNTRAVTISQALLANGTGGLSKIGTGTLTLGGTSTYTGNTSVTAGALALTGTGAINASSGITVNGSGAKFVDASSVAVSPTITLTSGTVDGTGTINTVNVASGASNTIANGNGGTGSLTIGALTFAGAGNFNVNVASTSPVVATTTLNTSGAGNLLVNATNANWLQGTYNLISYGTLGGSGFGAFQKGTISGLSNRQSATLSNPAGFISLVIAGDNPRWSGALSNEWSTNVLSNPKNWALITSGTPTDYIQGDIVLFDDNATTTTPSISVANVSPTSVQFNNPTKSYTLSGGFGIAGTTGLTKDGAAALTITNANSYSGNTVLNAGTLNINNASAIGTGTLVVAGGTTIDNTLGSTVTLSTNNAQTWAGDFTFGGSNSLNLGTGTATMTNGDRTVTTNGAGTLTVGGVGQSGGTRALIKAGSGTLAISGNTSSYTGNTTVNAGTLSITGTVTTSPIVNVNNGANLDVSGTLSNTQTNINNGTVNVSGTMTSSGDYWVGLGSGGNGSLAVQSGGTVTANVLLIGAGGSPTAVATGTITSGGTINTNRWFVVGQSGAVGSNGQFTMNGGTLNVHTSTTLSGNLEVGTFDPTVATMDINAGSVVKLQNNAAIAFGAQPNHSGIGTINQNAGTVTFYSDGGTTVGGTGATILGAAGSGTYTYNLNGGTLTTPRIQRNTGTGVFNFNGGTLKPTATQANFMAGLTRANIRNNPAVIDTDGFDATVAQPLAHSDVGGDSATDGGLVKSGAGTLTLTSASTYTGGTTIHAGTLLLAGGGIPAPVASYSFEGNAAVNSGTGGAAMDGANLGADLSQAGQFGNAATFDGFGSSIDIASGIVDLGSAAKWTVTGWLKTTQSGATVFSKNTGGGWLVGNSIFYLSDGNNPGGGGGKVSAVRNSGGWVTGTTNVNDGSWHFITYTDNAGVKTIYVDGVAEVLTQAAFNNNDAGNTVQLGYPSDTVPADGTEFLNGALDELKFYDTALTASQVNALRLNNTLGVDDGLNVLPSTTAVNIDTPGAVLDIGGTPQTIGSLTGVAGTSVLLGSGQLKTGDATNTAFAGVISGSGALIKQGSGTFTLTGANTATGNTTVTAGTLTIATSGSVASGNLTADAGATLNVNGSIPVTAAVNANGTVNFAGNTTAVTTTRTIGALSIGSGGLAKITASSFPFTPAILKPTGVTFADNTSHLDVTNNELIVPSTTLAVVVPQITSGKIMTSSTGGGLGSLQVGADVEVRFTLLGDTNLDGKVDVTDLGNLASNYGAISGATWVQGDTNYSSTVDVTDLGNLASNYGGQLAAGPSAGDSDLLASSLASVAGASGAAVPEPASIGAMGLAAIGLLGRRHRRR